MELINKDKTMKIIRAGSKLNNIINILTNEIVEKVDKQTVIEVDEEMLRCKVCGRRCMSTRNDAEDVWLVDEDGKLICGMCSLQRRQL